MITTDRAKELKKLHRRREVLREKLKKHFSLAIAQRDYKEFEAVVDELDGLRTRIHALRGKGANDEN